jgi:hypothetical protein
LIGYKVLEEDDGQVVVRVIVVSAGFAGESHASQWAELSGDRGFDLEMEVYEILRDVETGHFFNFK